MKVCIAEKPSVAREIANILGANIKHDGYFEGNGYQVTYTFGHLCTLLEPSDYKPHWKSWDLNNLPMLPDRFETKVSNNEGIQKQFKIVERLFNSATEIINCGDAGQEGELIQRWVINQSGYTGPVKRLWISSLTTEAIKEGFANLVDATKYDNLYYAGYSRAIGDWLLGINATRLYTVKYGNNKQVISIGRVQTPTLAMVVNRFREIENFVPQPYWELQTTYRDTLFSYEEGRFTNKEDGEKLAKIVQESDFEITKITKKNGKEYSPKLFDLTGLQVYCNNKFGFTADETLKIIQKLYEMKVVTYPRVDTTFLPSDIYPKVPNILRGLTSYSQFTAPVLEKKIRKSTKVFNDKKVTDHHAIIPTGVEIPLQDNLLKVYDIIARRFIAVFYDDCTVANTTVLGKADEVTFKTLGKVIIDKGWRVVLDTNTKSVTDNILPNFEKGEKGPHIPSFLEKKTKAPGQYTEATLLRAMETAGKQVDDDEMRELMKENGIGRPSTRASIIETLFKRKYIERKKKQILPTSIGIQLIDIIQNKLLKSAELTGAWEKQLKQIESGEFKAGTFIHNMKQMVDQLVYEVRSSNNTYQIDYNKKQQPIKKETPASELTCPKCKTGTILKGKKAFGCSEYGKSCDFIIPFTYEGKKLTDKQVERLVEKGSTLNIKGFKHESGFSEGKLSLNKTFDIVFEPKIPDQISCPKCKQGTIIKGNTAYGCDAFSKGCDFKISFSTIREKAEGQELDKKLVYSIIQNAI